MRRLKQVKKILFLVLLLTLIQITACNTINNNIKKISNSFIKSELYFGLSKPDGGAVTENEWDDFVKNYITPSFKEGITIIDAKGQWLSLNGEIVKENSKIVVIIHKDLKETYMAIEKIKEKYKKMFKQESVLEVNCFINASF